MSEHLQSLLEKINRDGVEKAQAEADRIISAAKEKAASLVKAANEEAAKSKADAEKSAADYAKRAQETVRQAARDVVLEVAGAIEKKLVKLLAADVKSALADGATVKNLVTEAVKGIAGDAEVALPKDLLPALQAQLAKETSVKIVLDENLDSGFTVRRDGGRIENSFTADTIVRELAKRLRPDLAALLK